MFEMPFFLLPQAMQDDERARVKRIREAEKRHFEEVMVPSAVDWNLNVKFGKSLCIRASSWKPETLFDVEAGPVGHSNVGLQHKFTVEGQYGEEERVWGYRHVTLPRGERLWIRSGQRKGDVCFDGDVVLPALYQGNPARGVWMSMTPMEFFTQRTAVRKATGHVVIGGLGMGWLLRRVLEKKSVTKVTVVEKSSELCRWFGGKLCMDLAVPGGKPISLVEDDVFHYLGAYSSRSKFRHKRQWRTKSKSLLDPECPPSQAPKADTILLDVWKSYGSAYQCPYTERVRELHPGTKVWAWGAVNIGEQRY